MIGRKIINWNGSWENMAPALYAARPFDMSRWSLAARVMASRWLK